ncbi:MAG: flagellar biosynthesis protein FliQ [bacterium]|nr:flagellar biosynthesis protein FliQ [bacterium]MCM1375630.1 flagellar biosynthesis protein FliQ [Muribaculum sp.]
MTVEGVAEIASRALMLIIKVSMPVLLVSLCIGLLVSIFQTVTSIQEQTLTFVPKIIGIFVALIIMGPWMMNSMAEFMTELWSNFSLYVSG